MVCHIPPRKGKFCVIEGTDRSGKDTQTRMLVERLNSQGISTTKLSFPRYHEPTGRIIGECYLGKDGKLPWFPEPTKLDPRVASLYYAADRVDAAPNMIHGIENGINYVSDRWVESNIAHQGGKVEGEKRKEIVKFIRDLEYGLLKLPKPDKVIFLFMPYKVGAELGRKSGERADAHEADLSHLESAQRNYLDLAEKFRWTKINCAPDGTIKSLRTPEDISQEVYKTFMSLFK